MIVLQEIEVILGGGEVLTLLLVFEVHGELLHGSMHRDDLLRDIDALFFGQIDVLQEEVRHTGQGLIRPTEEPVDGGVGH